MPRALLASVVMTSLLYLLRVGRARPDRASGLASSDSPLAAAAVVAPWLGKTLAVTALFPTASTTLISLVNTSCMLFGMARDGDLPRHWAER